MKHDKPEYNLFDFYTKVQLLEIAKHNNVEVSKASTKLTISKAIVDAKGEQYLIPKDMTPGVRNLRSKVRSLGAKENAEYLAQKADMIDEQWKNVLSEEENAARQPKNYKRVRDGKVIDPNEKIAVYSERNVFWEEVGRLQRGYSFMTREEAKPWLQLRGVREATPDEVAMHFNL